MQSLNYPVMIVSPNYFLGQIQSEKQLTKIGEMQYEKGCLDNCFILDSKGYRYSIVSTRKIKTLFSFFNYRKKYRAIRVGMELSKPTMVKFDEFKNFMIETIIQKRWYGEDIGVGSESELRKWFSSANNFNDLIMIADVFSK